MEHADAARESEESTNWGTCAREGPQKRGNRASMRRTFTPAATVYVSGPVRNERRRTDAPVGKRTRAVVVAAVIWVPNRYPKLLDETR